MLEESANLEVYESLFRAQDELGQGFFMHDIGRLLYTNEACARISGYTLRELKAMESIYALVVSEQRDLLLDRQSLT